MPIVNRRKFIGLVAATAVISACSPDHKMESESPATTTGTAPVYDIDSRLSTENTVFGMLPAISGRINLYRGINIQEILDKLNSYQGAWVAQYDGKKFVVKNQGAYTKIVESEYGLEISDASSESKEKSLLGVQEGTDLSAVSATLLDGTGTETSVGMRIRRTSNGARDFRSGKSNAHSSYYLIGRNGELRDALELDGINVAINRQTKPGEEATFEILIKENVDPNSILGLAVQKANGSTIFMLRDATDLSLTGPGLLA